MMRSFLLVAGSSCTLYSKRGCRQQDPNIISDLIKNGNFSQSLEKYNIPDVFRRSLQLNQVKYSTNHSLLMWFKSACLHGWLSTSLQKRVGSQHRACLHPTLLQQAEHLPAAGNLIQASQLDLDKDVPPSPFHRCLVNANEWGKRWHSQESFMLQYKHLTLLSSSSLLQFIHVS